MVNKEIIENDLSDRLIAVHKSSFKRLFNKEMNISVFAEDRIDSEGKDKASKTKHCRFVEVTQNGKSMFISKTTAVWLLQEGERVSTDRLFRVRSKQPYTCDAQPEIRSTSDLLPSVSNSLNVGDICVFNRSQGQWQIGRVLQFSFFLEKTKSAQQYRGM